MTKKTSDTDIQSILEKDIPAYIGFFDGLLPYVIPVDYLYCRQALYIMAAPAHAELFKRAGMDACLAIDGRMTDDEWCSLSLWGKCSGIKEDVEKRVILSGFYRKYTPGNGSPLKRAAAGNEIILRIDILHKKGYVEKPYSQRGHLPALHPPVLTGKVPAALLSRA